jgi:O-antigen ligase
VAAWSLFAFAGAFPLTVVPILAAAAALPLVTRPRLFTSSHRFADLTLAACLAVVWAQLVPLPPGLRDRLSPHAAAVQAALAVGGAPRGWAPLSLHPEATLWAAALATALAAIFWCARMQFERHGGRTRVVRSIAAAGLGLAVLTFVQRAITPGLMYGVVAPERNPSLQPLGPFVNRNDFAAWVIMALPVVLGYIVARVTSRPRALTVNELIDRRMTWLVLSACLLTAALFASLSRSGLIGVSVAFLGLIAYGGTRHTGPGYAGMTPPASRWRWTAAALLFLISMAAGFGSLPALAGRVGEAIPSGLGGRIGVWQQTWPMARDFWLTGVGAGAFERGMLVYQQSTRLIFLNHAHNEYLQVLVEGGLLLAVPAALLAAAAVGEIRTGLRKDRSALVWLRVGAAAGLAAIAAQSIWDTALRMPANGVLFAIIAALATYIPADGDGSGVPERAGALFPDHRGVHQRGGEGQSNQRHAAEHQQLAGHL